MQQTQLVAMGSRCSISLQQARARERDDVSCVQIPAMATVWAVAAARAAKGHEDEECRCGSALGALNEPQMRLGNLAHASEHSQAQRIGLYRIAQCQGRFMDEHDRGLDIGRNQSSSTAAMTAGSVRHVRRCPDARRQRGARRTLPSVQQRSGQAASASKLAGFSPRLARRLFRAFRDAHDMRQIPPLFSARGTL
jgi:hypothetical protein